MQGFFGKPVDNLFAEFLIARWIKANVPGWDKAVAVSKNPGGTKRVTSLADALKLNFGIITTDKRRGGYGGMNGVEESGILNPPSRNGESIEADDEKSEVEVDQGLGSPRRKPSRRRTSLQNLQTQAASASTHSLRQTNGLPGQSPLSQSTRPDSPSSVNLRSTLIRSSTSPMVLATDSHDLEEVGEEGEDEYTDERARDIVRGRLVQGHIVDDDHPSPMLSAMSNSISTLPGDRNSAEADNTPDLMEASFVSTVSSFHPDHALGGTADAVPSSDEEEEVFKNPELEHTVTLVGHVRDKIVFLVDDMIDKSGSWIAAAETVVKRGGAKKVYCIATHGLFGGDSLEEMEDCECIDHIVVTNSFPMSPALVRSSRKLAVIDLSNLLAEAIRRNHFGESISALFNTYD